MRYIVAKNNRFLIPPFPHRPNSSYSSQNFEYYCSEIVVLNIRNVCTYTFTVIIYHIDIRYLTWEYSISYFFKISVIARERVRKLVTSNEFILAIRHDWTKSEQIVFSKMENTHFPCLSCALLTIATRDLSLNYREVAHIDDLRYLQKKDCLNRKLVLLNNHIKLKL